MQFLMDNVITEATEKLQAVNSISEFEELKALYLGPRGVVRSAMKEMGHMPVENRPDFGKKVNQVKERLESLLAEKLLILENSSLMRKMGKPVDLSLTPRNELSGNLHPLSKVRDNLVDIFRKIGFVVADGPEIESEWFCFDALNTPPSHPARDVMDTFFIPNEPIETTSRHGQERYLLRSHTSTVQIRTMLKAKPPIRIVAPGRTFRRDTVDATHSANFHQFEALCVDKNVTVCDLKSTLHYFLQELFGKSTETRLRPSFFPFTEPSFEVDFKAPDIGKLSNQWIEVLGCGMVDPNVLEAVGIDSKHYSGFALGLGIERIAMLKYGIDDVRLFYQNDKRFLEQF